MSLTPEHREYLRSAAITDETIEAAGLRSALSREDLPEGLAGMTVLAPVPGILFPYRDREGNVVTHRYRPDNPAPDPHKDGKPAKYVGEPGKNVVNHVRATANGKILVVEGEKQQLAAASYAPEGFGVVGIPGCWTWKGTDLSWANGAAVCVAFDADRRTNPKVARAAWEFAAALKKAGATAVRFVDFPGHGTDGLDDVLARLDERERAQSLREWIANSVQPEPPGGFEPIDWDELFAEDFSQVTFHVGGFVEPGQQMSLIGDGKVGKSLFVADWGWRAVTGQRFLNDQVDPDKPSKVLYLDAENSRRDIQTRMIALGATPADLRNFIYLSFPPVKPLDTDEGARQVLSLVDRYKPDIVILDTVSRFVEGKENDSDTWLNLYRRLHRELKARGVTGVRLDHFGKDAEKGGRGSSAKSQDIDHVWELVRTGGSENKTEDGYEVITHLVMKRTHTRTGLGEGRIDIKRYGILNKNRTQWLPGSTYHEVEGDENPFEPDTLSPADRRRIPKIYEVLRGAPEGVSHNEVCRAVGGRKTDVGITLSRLVGGGYLSRTKDARNAYIYKIIKEFDRGE